MNTVFVSGSMRIKHLDIQVRQRLDTILEKNMRVLVGDAGGVDLSIQQYLLKVGAKNVIVYCSGDKPRNNVGNWSLLKVLSRHEPGTRAFFTAKDKKMAEDADYGLMVWDAKSTGTLSNAIELLKAGKNSRVFVNKEKEFQDITKVSHLEKLLKNMSDSAFQKAENKLKIYRQIRDFKEEQLSFL